MGNFAEGNYFYRRARYTQSISVLNGQDSIVRVPLTEKWKTSGGLLGIQGWRSLKAVNLKQIPEPYISNVQVLNSSKNYQYNRQWRREWPVGTVFTDTLINDKNIVFEVRQRSKEAIDEDYKNGYGWSSEIVYRDPEARPLGYSGLKETCNSCHNQAGYGVYASNDGLVPGSDTIISFPLLD